MFNQAVTAFGRQTWYDFDRGYAGKCYQLVNEEGRRVAYQIARGPATQVRRWAWDTHQQQWRAGVALALAVTHPDYPEHALWLVVFRLGKGW